MNTSDIVRYLTKDPACNDQLVGVYAKDTLPAVVGNKPALYIVNTDKAAGLGRHWIVMYFPPDEPAEFFDSLGHSPDFYTTHFVTFLTNNSESYKYLKIRLQDFRTETCGHYCIFYCLHRCNGWTLERVVDYFDKYCKTHNDHIVCQLYT